MSGSTNPFGKSSLSPFDSQSVLGQTNASKSNPFGGTSTSVFGAPQTSSPLSSTTTFGGASSPAFGSSLPDLGSSSTSAFGNSSSPFSGSSVFDQNPVFGGFGSTTQTSPFVSTGQPSQPALGSIIFGSSTPFGASSQQTSGSMSTPAINSSSIPEFCSTSTTTIGATSTPESGSTISPTFDSPGSAFRVSSPLFGAGGGFGASSTPLFGSSTTIAFGTSATPAFGVSTPSFTTPSFTFGSTQTLGSRTPSSAFGSTHIGQSNFGGQWGGSRVINFAPTAEADGGTSGQTAKLESISAMPFYKDKSHEELRWEDYQIGDKYGSTYEQTAKLVSISAIPIYKDKSHEELRWEDYQVGNAAHGGTSGQTAKSESISAMPIYKDNSHEELRWEDYQIGDKVALCLEVLRLVYLVHLNLHLLSPQQPSSVLLHQSLAVQCLLLCHHQLQLLVIHLHHLLLVLGGFGSTTQTSPFGIAGQLSQAACGSRIFGSSTPFGASSQSTFGSLRTPTFGFIGTPTLGATSTPAFGSTTSPTFGSTSAFGVSSPLFGAGGGFGASSTPLFGYSTTAFGTSKTPAFGASSAPAFSASSTPLFSFGSTQTFGQSTSAFGSSPFGSASSPFGVQSSPFGAQTTSSAVGIGSIGIGQSGFGGQRSGSTVAKYAPTAETDGSTSGHATKLDSKSAMPFYENKSHKELGSQSSFGDQQGGSMVAKYAPTAEADCGTSGQTATLKSISAMPIYKDKSHEGLKWEDHPIGDKVSQTSSAFGSTGIGPSGFEGQQCGSRVAKYAPTAEENGSTFEQTAALESISAMPIYKAKSHEELRWEDYQIGVKGGPLNSTQSIGLVGFSSNTTQRNTFAPSPTFGQLAANPFSTSTPSNPFASKSSAFCSGFGTTFTSFSSSAFATSTSATRPIFGSSTSTFGNTSPSPLFNSPAPGANLESENEEKTCCKFSELDLGKERVSSPREAESQNEEERKVSGQEGYDSDRNCLPAEHVSLLRKPERESAELKTVKELEGRKRVR